MPNISLYQSALQHPDRCFTDEELKEATVVKMGGSWMPYARSGQFAVVFKLETKNGTRAVRCFYHPKTEHEERYRLFHEHIHSQPLGYLTEFEYLPQGIILEEGCYPIVKMEWVEGETLDKRVESLVEKPDIYALEKLSLVWCDAVVGLRRASIAHGDMQHGNILTRNGSLCLVDYDGVFIPSFQGKNPLEIGHKNYQHPGRGKSGSFGLHIDHFSSFVIYLSIKALATDPQLWKKFHQEESLILQQDDYAAPHRSQVLKALKKNSDPQIRELADKLEDICKRQVDAVPPFDSLVEIPTTEPTKTPAVATNASETPWWNELQGFSSTPTPVIPSTGTPQESVVEAGSATGSQIPTQPHVSPPTQKKRRKRKWLIFLFILFVFTACSMLCLAVLGDYLGYYY